MDTSTIPIDPSLQSPEAGPSHKPSPPSITSPLPPAASEPVDVVMEDIPTTLAAPISSATASNPANEEVALLLNISSSTDPRPGEILKPPLLEQSISPKDSTFPHTPPDEPHHPSQTPGIRPQPSSSLSNMLEPQDLLPNGASSSPQANTPEPIPKAPKGKRKRNAQAGPSRSNDPERPPHWMGEDNTVIRCICGIIEDDGFTIQCEECGAWEHGLCFGYQDEESAPEIYLCELCEPRPYDAEAARARQRDARLAEDHRRLAMNLSQPTTTPIQPLPAESQPRKGKGRKRPRAPGNVEGEGEATTEQVKDQSPAGPGPGAKPKRRPTANKPRSKPAPEPAPGPSTAPVFKEPLPPVDIDDEYFTVEPWEMEYTHVQHNVVRGKAVRQALAEFYREWADADVEDISSSKRVVTNPSGLPSPTETGVLRLSTEDLYPGPDFNVLAPPIPPVFLTGPNLELLVAHTHVEAINDPVSFLPLNYAEVASLGVYRHPAIYGVILDKPVSTGAFIGEYRGEVIDCETYRRDRVNQYSQLGMTKPFVRTIGPPVNLMIDARGYGSHMRFVRSSCHPNAVLRPLLWRKDEREPAKLKFGLFACRPISRDEEITLGWEWDDQHVVHSLRHVIISILAPDSDFGFSDADLQNVTGRCEKILTHLYGTFTSCACIKPANCAVAQMRLLVEGKDPLVELNEKGKVRVDFGDLVGAVRGWRKRELQEEERKRWEVPGAFGSRRFIPSRSVSTSPTPAHAERAIVGAQAELKEDVDIIVEEKDDEDDETEDDLPQLALRDRQSSPASEAEQDVSMTSTPGQSPQIAAPPLPASSILSSAPPGAPSLPSRPHVRAPSVSPSPSPAPEEEDDGHASDATTITIPRSQFSEAEDLSESDVEERKVAPVAVKIKTKQVSPIKEKKVKVKSNGKVKKARADESAQSRPPVSRRPTGRKNRVMSSPASDSELERMDIDEPTRSSVKKAKQSLPTVPSPQTSPIQPKEDLPPVVPGQIVAPMSDPTEAVPADDVMMVDPVVTVEEPSREGTPKEPTPPKEPSPPARDPTPEPEPKKISLTEYLRKHKMSKKPTPSSEHEPLPDVSTGQASADSKPSMDQGGSAAVPVTTSAPSVNASVPASGAASTTTSPVSSVPKTETDGSAARLNLLEFLPSSRPSTSPVATTSTLPVESPRPMATPSSTSYVPRSEYFPQQQQQQQQQQGPAPATPAFVPRSSSMSFAPRPPGTPAEDAPNGFHAPFSSSAFTPRQNSIDTSAFLPPRQDEIKPMITPPPRASSLPDGTPMSAMSTSVPTGPSPTPGLPPALPHRDPPPHASTPVRQPPTGPKVPPSGPRGYPVPPLAANRPVGTVEPRGEGIGGPRMNFIPAPRPAYARGGYGRIGDRFEGERGGYGGFRGRGGFGRGRGRGA